MPVAISAENRYCVRLYLHLSSKRFIFNLCLSVYKLGKLVFNAILFVSFNSNTVDAICSAGTDYPFGTIGFTLGFFVGLVGLRFPCSVS